MGYLRQCAFTYPRSGKVFVCVDGPEILVYSGNDDGPLWKQFFNERVVGVGVASEEVFALEEGGRLVKLRLIDGEYLDEDQLGMAATGLVMSHDEVLAVISHDELFVRHPAHEPMRVAISSVVSVAFGPDGGSIGLGTSDGTFYAVDTRTGGAWGSVNVHGSVTGVAWSALNHWVICAGNQIHCVSGDGAQVTESIAVGGIASGLATSVDGSMVAVLTDETTVKVFEWLNKTVAGSVWFQRNVQAIGFGPSSWLGMGHDEGDGNRVDLFTGTMARTQAHEGRGQHSWPMQVEVNSALLRGTSTTLRAGNAPIAVQVRSQEHEEKRSKAWIWAVLAIAVGFVFLSAFLILFCGFSGPLIRGPKYYFLW